MMRGWGHMLLKIGTEVRPVTGNQDSRLALAMAAWKSHIRNRREAEHWQKIFEQRISRLSDEDRSEIQRLTDEP